MAEVIEDRYAAFADDEDPFAGEPLPDEEQTTLERLVAQFGDAIHSTSTRLGEPTASIAPGSLLQVMTWLRDEANFALLSDLTSHDCHGQEPRFWVIYQLTNPYEADGLRVKVGLPEKKPVIESVVPIWPGANFLEREVYDLMGVEFQNHPSLKRIMMPDEWEGHPLRKDYPRVYEPVQFTHNAAEVAARKPFAQR